MIKESRNKLNGLTLHTVKTQKYKTNSIVLKLKAPLNEETVTKRALLAYVLQSGTSQYPSTLKLRSYLDDLYGATLFVDVAKKGEYQVISFRMDIANEKYLTDSTPLLEKGLEFLSQILLSPVVESNAFSSNIVEKEKRTLIQKIQSVFDDKMRYANMRLLEEMCETEPYRLHTHGRKEDVESLTPESLYAYYEQVLEEDEIDLYVIGDINEGDVENFVKNKYKLPSNRKGKPLQANTLSKQPIEEKEVLEEQEINQGKLHLGYRTFVTFSDDDYYALQLFNGIFGGFSHSKLFLNVREKASLAYYAASRFESHKGLLLVMSGIEFANYKQAVQIIKEQMEHMREGNFTENEMEQTKAVIRNQILETIDTANGLIEVLYHNVISNTERPIDQLLEGIEKVTHQQIKDVANKVKLDTIYFLKGKESE